MKVKRLIALLKKQDPEAQVVVAGYEAGYDDVNRVGTIPLKLNVNPKATGYYGRHMKARYNEKPDAIGIQVYDVRKEKLV